MISACFKRGNISVPRADEFEGKAKAERVRFVMSSAFIDRMRVFDIDTVRSVDSADIDGAPASSISTPSVGTDFID